MDARGWEELRDKLRHRCAEEIDAAGYFAGVPRLREAFLTVPREHFVPERCWWPRRDVQGVFPLLDRSARPKQWMKSVYRPFAALVTQVDDGAVTPDAPTGCDRFSSSISCPAVVAEMLQTLDAQPGETVLEIGTGTGYNSALLAQLVGGRHVMTGEVVTGEIDAPLAALARQRLLELLGEQAPLVLALDATAGYAPRAPFDRILSTAAVRTVPAAWLSQVRAGGVIVTPLATPMGYDGLLRLECDGAGSASGRLRSKLSFMKVRGQRETTPWADLGWPHDIPPDRPLTDYRVDVHGNEQQVNCLRPSALHAGNGPGPVRSL